MSRGGNRAAGRAGSSWYDGNTGLAIEERMGMEYYVDLHTDNPNRQASFYEKLRDIDPAVFARDNPGHTKADYEKTFHAMGADLHAPRASELQSAPLRGVAASSTAAAPGYAASSSSSSYRSGGRGRNNRGESFYQPASDPEQWAEALVEQRLSMEYYVNSMTEDCRQNATFREKLLAIPEVVWRNDHPDGHTRADYLKTWNAMSSEMHFEP